MAKNDLRHLPLNQVRPSEVALRSVDKDSEKYLEMVQSVKQVGILNPILVHEIKDTETGKTIFGLIDGLHRYTSSIDAGLETIPAHIVSADEADKLEMQIIANLHVVETKAAEYSRNLHKLIALNPSTTVLEQANKLGKSITWVNERLSLVKLTDKLQTLVNDGTINVTNASALAKLPQEEQENFADRASSMSPQEFVPSVSARVKEIKDAKRQGRKAEGPKPFEPAVYLQKIGDVKTELRELNIGKGLIHQNGLESAEQGWKMAIAWCLHLDPTSIELAKIADEKRKQAKEEANAKKKAEREAKKIQEGAAVAAGLSDDEE